jgi:biopolymer transport protein ExbB
MSALRDFIVHDWYFFWPMFFMSLAGMTLVIWRLLLNINGNTVMNEFLPVFQERLEKDGVEGALRFCRARTDIIPRRLFTAGLEVSKQGLAAVRRSMANIIELEILPDLNFLLPTILAIAKIATMVGLLGTVISMIGTFTAIQQSGGNAQQQSGAIGLALFATALGLVTAIPLVFAHVLFKAWVAQFETRMKSSAQKLTLLLQAVKPGAATSSAAVTTTPKTPGAAAGTPVATQVAPGGQQQGARR